MKKIIFIIIGVFMALQWGCRLEELEVECGIKNGFEAKFNAGFPTISSADIVEDTDGSYVVCGKIGGDADDIFLTKIDKNGNQVFFEQDNQSGQESAISLVSTADGGFLVCGFVDEGNSGPKTLFVKYDQNGKRISSEKSSIAESSCRRIRHTKDGRFAFVSRRTTSPRSIHAGIVSLSGDTIKITHEYAPPVTNTSPKTEVYDIIHTASHEYILSCEKEGVTHSGIYLFKMDENFEPIQGSEVFEFADNGSNTMGQGIIEADEPNQYILTGWNSGRTESFRYNDNTKNITIMSQHGDAYRLWGSDAINAHTKGQYVILGDYFEDFANPPLPRQIYLSQIDGNGTQIWRKILGDNTLYQRGSRVIQTSDCGYAVVGFEGYQSPQKAYIIKVDGNGNIQ